MAILFPVAFKESLVFLFCVIKAQDRAAYQKYSKWKKGEESPFQKEKDRDDFYFKKGHEFEVKVKRENK